MNNKIVLDSYHHSNNKSLLENSSSIVGSDNSKIGNNNNNTSSASSKTQFELPNIPDDDLLLIENILKGLQSLGTKDTPICIKYKVDIINNGYLIRGVLPPIDIFEIDLEDLLFVQSISPSRIEKVCIAKSLPQQPQCEMLIKVLDHKQKIMITSVTSFSATRKRKWRQI